MLIALSLRYLHLSQFFFTFLTKPLPCIMHPSSKTYLHTVSTPVLFMDLNAGGFHLLYCTLEMNACKSQVHKKCLNISLSLWLTFHNFHLSFLLLVSFLRFTEYHLSEMKSSDIHFLTQIL